MGATPAELRPQPSREHVPALEHDGVVEASYVGGQIGTVVWGDDAAEGVDAHDARMGAHGADGVDRRDAGAGELYLRCTTAHMIAVAA